MPSLFQYLSLRGTLERMLLCNYISRRCQAEIVHVYILYSMIEQYTQGRCCRNFQEIRDDYDNPLINKDIYVN